MKFLIWVLLGLLVYWALRTQLRRNRQKRRSEGPVGSARPSPRSSQPIEKMVACNYCQIYLPASEAVYLPDALSEKCFCSEEHAKLYQNSPHV